MAARIAIFFSCHTTRTMATAARSLVIMAAVAAPQGVGGFRASPALVRVGGAARAAIRAAGAREDDEFDFDFDERIDELERRVPSERKRDAALAEYGLSLPALVLLALSALMLGGTQILGPGWLSAIAGWSR